MTTTLSMADLGETVPTAYLASILRDAHARTLELVSGLEGDQLMGPKIPIVNPLVWEIGHVAWFHEYFILRRLYDQAPILANGDQIYDSIAIHHETRWDLPLLCLDDTLTYIERVLETLVDRLDGPTASPQDSYIYRFSTCHEDMHTEAYTYTRQTLAFPEPLFALAAGGPPAPAGPLAGDVAVPGGTLRQGSEEGTAFVFDNEKWAHTVQVAPFEIAPRRRHQRGIPGLRRRRRLCRTGPLGRRRLGLAPGRGGRPSGLLGPRRRRQLGRSPLRHHHSFAARSSGRPRQLA